MVTRPAGHERVAPASPAEVAALLADCSAAGRPVLPIGAGTWVSAAAGPLTAGPAATYPSHDPGSDTLVLSTSGLDAILEHEPADLVIGVQAGVALDSLRRHLAAHGQWLPLDPPADGRATIGAVVANASAGPLRALHGTPADLVLGIEVATGDGRLLHYGGRVVKNVAGYDGVRLFTGSRGALGVITAVYLRVRGLPRVDRTWALQPGANAAAPQATAPAAGAGLALALRDRVGCDALELMAPSTAAAVGLPGAWTVLARVTGGEAAVDEASGRIEAVAAATGAAVRTLDETSAPTVWKALCGLEAEATDYCVTIGLPSRTGDMLAAWSGSPAASGITVAPAATAASGGAAGVPHGHAAAHAADGVIRTWSSPAPQARARPVPEAGPDAGRRVGSEPLMPPVAPTPADAIAARLATAFDPAGILMPGRALRRRVVPDG